MKNLRSGKEGWVAAANLLSLISESKSSQSLSSSGWLPFLVFTLCCDYKQKLIAHLSCRWQRLWEPKHLFQLQRDLHQLLRHQTLTEDPIPVPQPLSYFSTPIIKSAADSNRRTELVFVCFFISFQRHTLKFSCPLDFSFLQSYHVDSSSPVRSALKIPKGSEALTYWTCVQCHSAIM